jgi:hypothetical protein
VTDQLLYTTAWRHVLTKDETKDSKACKGLGDAAHEGQNAPEEDQDRCICSHRKLLEQESRRIRPLLCEVRSGFYSPTVCSLTKRYPK